MTKISIQNDFKTDYITRVAGEKLRHQILKAAQSGRSIEIDFTGVVIGSTSFFDEGIGKLSDEGWNKDAIDRKIVLKNINPFDLQVLQRVRAYRGV